MKPVVIALTRKLNRSLQKLNFIRCNKMAPIFSSMLLASTANSNKDPSQPQGNCKRKCFTLQLGNTECKIICEPPVIEQPAPAPAYGAYPQQAIYGQAQPYPYLGQMSAPCTPPACQPGQMYAGYTQAQQYPVQAAYPAIGTRPAPVQEGCVGRSCDQPKDENKESQSDKPEKQEKQDKPAPAAPKPAQASAPYTFKVQYDYA